MGLPLVTWSASDSRRGLELVPKADAAGIRVFLLNEGLMVAEKGTFGEPRENYPLWLGEIVPDESRYGYLLAESLIGEAHRHGLLADDGKIHLSALTGVFTFASISRVSGLRAAVAEHDDVHLTALLPANWEKERARNLTAEALSSDPETSVVWSASDYMVLGAIDAIDAAGKSPGKNVLGGGDWAPFVATASSPRRWTANSWTAPGPSSCSSTTTMAWTGR